MCHKFFNEQRKQDYNRTGIFVERHGSWGLPLPGQTLQTNFEEACEGQAQENKNML